MLGHDTTPGMGCVAERAPGTGIGTTNSTRWLTEVRLGNSPRRLGPLAAAPLPIVTLVVGVGAGFCLLWNSHLRRHHRKNRTLRRLTTERRGRSVSLPQLELQCEVLFCFRLHHACIAFKIAAFDWKYVIVGCTIAFGVGILQHVCSHSPVAPRKSTRMIRPLERSTGYSSRRLTGESLRVLFPIRKPNASPYVCSLVLSLENCNSTSCVALIVRVPIVMSR